ncbi:MAG: hypothetical protein ACREV3_12985 [Gammaproteobacteria bacterium]
MKHQNYLNRYGYLLLVIPPLVVMQLAALFKAANHLAKKPKRKESESL